MALGLRIGLPFLRVHYAEMLTHAGDLDRALKIVAEVMEQIEREGWGEAWPTWPIS